MADTIKEYELKIVEKDIVMTATETKVEVSEQKVDSNKFQVMIDNLNDHVNNMIKEKVRVQDVYNEQVAKMDAQIVKWQAEITEMQKQMATCVELEKELPKEDAIEGM